GILGGYGRYVEDRDGREQVGVRRFGFTADDDSLRPAVGLPVRSTSSFRRGRSRSSVPCLGGHTPSLGRGVGRVEEIARDSEDDRERDERRDGNLQPWQLVSGGHGR